MGRTSYTGGRAAAELEYPARPRGRCSFSLGRWTTPDPRRIRRSPDGVWTVPLQPLADRISDRDCVRFLIGIDPNYSGTRSPVLLC